MSMKFGCVFVKATERRLSLSGEKMKKFIIILVFLVSSIVLLSSSILAYQNGFGGTIRYEICDVSTPTYGDGNNVSSVDWNYAPDGGKFNVWFSLYNEDRLLGKSLFYGYTNGAINLKEPTKNTSKYKLAANREHIGNPDIYISGTWQP